MTHLDVYVAELADGPDPLYWPGTTWSGNTAGRIGPYFPPAAGYGQPFFELRRRIENGKYKGKRIDWGAWATVMSKGQILDFVVERYEIIDGAEIGDEKLRTLLAFVRALPDDKRYALIAEEL